MTGDRPPAPTLSETERAEAFRRTEPKIPPRFALLVVGLAAVLGVAGVIGERVISGIGLNPSSAATETPPPVPSSVVSPSPSAPSTPEVGAPLPAFMGITVLGGGPAPAVILDDQGGRVVTLAGEHGEAIVLSFFDAPCQDICPVVSAELVQAAADLGKDASRVAFLTVDTDPLELSASPASQAAARDGLAHVAQWRFLTGTLPALDAVWRAYGVSVQVSPTTGLVAHNDVIYFIDPAGRLRYRATPFADEDTAGVFRLPPASVARWGQGIATYARAVLGARS